MKLETKIDKTLSVGVIFDRVGEGVLGPIEAQNGSVGPQTKGPLTTIIWHVCPYTYRWAHFDLIFGLHDITLIPQRILRSSRGHDTTPLT